MVPMMAQEKVPNEQFIYPGPEFPNTYTHVISMHNFYVNYTSIYPREVSK